MLAAATAEPALVSRTARSGSLAYAKMSTVEVARLGVDFGRVINDAGADPSADDTSFLSGSEEDMLATPQTAGAFESLRHLVPLFDGQVWVISKAGPRVQAKTERWLAHHDFYASTGIGADHIRFVRQRADKAAVCRELGITHFVDDRADVLEHLVGVVTHLYLFGRQTLSTPSHLIAVPTWEIAEQSIRETVAGG